MKKIFLISIFFLSLFSSCNKREIERLQLENKRLQSEKVELEVAQNDFFNQLAEIESNLSQITNKSNIISIYEENGNISPQNSQQKILQEVETIKALIDENKEKLDKLQKELKNSKIKITSLDKLIEQYKERTNELELSISNLISDNKLLKTDLLLMECKNKNLKSKNIEKDTVISIQNAIIETAYYVIGSEKELLQNNIITKKGGFLGIGKSIAIKKDFNSKYFDKINTESTKVIETNASKIDILSLHPSDSYSIDSSNPQNLKIKILNPSLFWDNQKYLVIEIIK